MRDYLEIGSTPGDENCEQVGTEGYNPARAKAECRAYIGQLRRQHGPEPEGARLVVRGNPHDFGTYHEVAVSYDSDNEAAIEYAYKVEGDTPAEWDDEARAELAAFDRLGRSAKPIIAGWQSVDTSVS